VAVAYKIRKIISNAHKKLMKKIIQGVLDRIATATIGKSMVNCHEAKDGRISLRAYRKCRSRLKMLKNEFAMSQSYLKRLNDIVIKHFPPVTEPIILISQIQRSGGTLLSQLFDGHPEIHAHPSELMIGYPLKSIWPKLDLTDNPERWFEVLFEERSIVDFNESYFKGQKDDKKYPFIFLPFLQRNIFLNYVSSIKPLTMRDILNAYMTSYFGAWLNNQNNYGRKKFIIAFTPRLAMVPYSIESFFDVYPDGKLISVIRSPKNWYPSAYKHNPKKKRYGDINHALNQWNENARSMLRNKERWDNMVSIIQFEDLIKKTKSVMRYLAGYLDIPFHRILLKPTYNKFPIRADTSFELEQTAILKNTLFRYKTLTREELKTISDMTDDVYQRVLEKAVSFQ
jgi:hypothetical protein